MDHFFRIRVSGIVNDDGNLTHTVMEAITLTVSVTVAVMATITAIVTVVVPVTLAL